MLDSFILDHAHHMVKDLLADLTNLDPVKCVQDLMLFRLDNLGWALDFWKEEARRHTSPELFITTKPVRHSILPFHLLLMDNQVNRLLGNAESSGVRYRTTRLSFFLMILVFDQILIITPGSVNFEEKKCFWLNKCPKLSSLGIDHRRRKTIPLRNSPGGKEFFRASLYVWYLQYWALCDDLVDFKMWAGVRYLSFSTATAPECILWKRSREDPTGLKR